MRGTRLVVSTVGEESLMLVIKNVHAGGRARALKFWPPMGISHWLDVVDQSLELRNDLGPRLHHVSTINNDAPACPPASQHLPIFFITHSTKAQPHSNYRFQTTSSPLSINLVTQSNFYHHNASQESHRCRCASQGSEGEEARRRRSCPWQLQRYVCPSQRDRINSNASLS